MHQQPSSAPPTDNASLSKVAGSVLIGTTIEWYEFQICGASAALMFAPLFFSGTEPWLAAILSFATIAVGL